MTGEVTRGKTQEKLRCKKRHTQGHSLEKKTEIKQFFFTFLWHMHYFAYSLYKFLLSSKGWLYF